MKVERNRQMSSCSVQFWTARLRRSLWLAAFLFLPGCNSAGLMGQPVANSPAVLQPVPRSSLQQLAERRVPSGGDESGFLLLDSGTEAFVQRAGLIELAEHSIDAQYYIWNSDISGLYLLRRLLLAADRGVQVRLLLDDINVSGRDRQIAALDSHPNIEIRIFNPSSSRRGPGKGLAFAADFERMNRRMHNKTFVVDGVMGIAGGRNIGDEYFDLHPHMNHRDRDVLALGPIVRAMSDNFLAYWNSFWAYPIDRLLAAPVTDAELEMLATQVRLGADDTSSLGRVPPRTPEVASAQLARLLPAFVWAPAELIYDPPADDMQDSTNQPKRTADALRQYALGARSEILVESAYLILASQQLELMAELREKGVRVAALTNSLASNDLVPNHAGYARWRVEMLAHGMELHELRPDAAACEIWIEFADFCDNGLVSLHAKSVVFDREILYVGSFNVNLRSIFLNGETLLIIHSPELAADVADDIENAMAPENSWQVTLDDRRQLLWTSDREQATREPQVGWWKRLKSKLVSWLPIEKYL